MYFVKQSCIDMIKNETRLSITNSTANEVISDNEDDIASKSDDTAEYNLLSLSTDSEENEESNEFINNNMDKNNLSDSNGVLSS